MPGTVTGGTSSAFSGNVVAAHPTEPARTESLFAPESAPNSDASALTPALTDSSNTRATSSASKPISRDSGGTQTETSPFSVIAANSEAPTNASLVGPALLAAQLPAPTGIATGGLSEPTAETLPSRGAQPGLAPTDPQEATPRGMELLPGEEVEPSAEPGEMRFDPQAARQLLDGQRLDIQALDGLLYQFLNRLTDLSDDWSESAGAHNAIAWVVAGSVALAGLEVGRRWRRRRTASLSADADWLGWIDLDGPPSEALL